MNNPLHHHHPNQPDQVDQSRSERAAVPAEPAPGVEAGPDARLGGRRALSVWETGHRTPTTQRGDHYTPETIAHPARMLPDVAGYAIEAFTSPGQLVADPMCGAGTSLVEAMRRGRPAFGVDIEARWAALARANLAHTAMSGFDSWARVLTADARALPGILPAEVAERVLGQAALVLTSPPYGPGTHGQVTTGAGPVRKSDFRYSPRGHAGRNLAYQPLHRLLAGFTQVLSGCVPLLAPDGLIAVTARPWREYGELVDLPDLLTHAAQSAGLVLVQRCVAVLGRLDGERVIDRASFFQRSTVAKGRRAGAPWHLIAHEDVLLFSPVRSYPGAGTATRRARRASQRGPGGPARPPGGSATRREHGRAGHHQRAERTGPGRSTQPARHVLDQVRAGRPATVIDPSGPDGSPPHPPRRSPSGPTGPHQPDREATAEPDTGRAAPTGQRH